MGPYDCQARTLEWGISDANQERHQPVAAPSLGTNVRHLLGMHNVSQQQLARYLGMSPQGLWNILHGRSEPRSRTAQRIAAAFGITMDALFADTGSCLRAAAGVFERAPVRSLSELDEPGRDGWAGLVTGKAV
jgi:transcriptional regulator with XRE-family HTH domain